MMIAKPVSRLGWLLLIVLVCLPWASGVQAQQNDERLIVAPDSSYTTIDAALAAARPGDVIEVHGGVYAAPLIIEKSVSLFGVGQPVIDGQGTGSLVVITAPDTHFEGFIVRNSGTNINHEDTGIVIQAPGVTVENNVVEDVLFGIYFANAGEGVARNNTVQCKDRELGLRGDGIRVWYSNDVTIIGNDVGDCRDTLIWYAQDITIEGNTFRHSRYGLHFMYSSRAVVENNTFEANSVGSYLMYSQHLTMTSNRMLWNRGPSGYGIALKDMDYVSLQDNVVVGNRAGLYIDNSPALYNINNFVKGNFFGYNDIGIAALPSTARNIFQRNTFLENAQQIGVLGRGNLLGNAWQQDGSGNYWSDYVGYDGDDDGIGDTPYRAEQLFESLADGEPVLRLFAFSPASQAIDFAASAFPSLRPDPKVIDEAPMMDYLMPVAVAGSPQTVSLPLLAATLLLVGIGTTICMAVLRGRTSQRTSTRRYSDQVQAGI
ncbi:MAG: nitrous oxide reductase family maturation protein NosD [Anaerolineae bacterium]|nr:nitrous oxide reductase family maturation protein NosD [Anaerolineae bacterium]